MSQSATVSLDVTQNHAESTDCGVASRTAIAEGPESGSTRRTVEAAAALAAMHDDGIEVFLTDTEGFCGVLKVLAEDFRVYEIGMDGQVARLDDGSGGATVLGAASSAAAEGQSGRVELSVKGEGGGNGEAGRVCAKASAAPSEADGTTAEADAARPAAAVGGAGAAPAAAAAAAADSECAAAVTSASKQLPVTAENDPVPRRARRISTTAEAEGIVTDWFGHTALHQLSEFAATFPDRAGSATAPPTDSAQAVAELKLAAKPASKDDATMPREARTQVYAALNILHPVLQGRHIVPTDDGASTFIVTHDVRMLPIRRHLTGDDFIALLRWIGTPASSESGVVVTVKVDESGDPKAARAARTAFHRALSAAAPFVVARTLEPRGGGRRDPSGADDTMVEAPTGQKRILIKRKPPKRRSGDARGSRGQGGGRSAKRSRRDSESGGGWLRFVIEKNDIEHLQAMRRLARSIGVDVSRLMVAGRKDKRAITGQWCTLRGVSSAKIAGCNGHVGGVKVGRVQPCPTGALGFGDLLGNQFRLVLRPPGTQAHDLSAVVPLSEALRGEPRFTPANVPTDVLQEATRQLSKRGFVNYYGWQRVGRRDSSVPQHRLGLALLRQQWREAVDMILLPESEAGTELSAARTAWSAHRDAKEALKLYPESATLERLLLERINRYGEGDGGKRALASMPFTTRNLHVQAFQSALWNRMASARVQLFGAHAPVVGDLVRVSRSGKDVALVTEADVAAARYSIDDVVLPLPGRNVRYPNNEIGFLYEEEAKRLGVTFDDTGTFGGLKGAYRSVLCRPAELTTRVVGRDPGDASEGLAVVAEFTLPAGSFATMCVRELMKC